MRASVLIRRDPHYRREAFCEGLARVGYQLVEKPFLPTRDDLLLIWNRYGEYHRMAEAFEKAGATVVVAENGPLGRDWCGGIWYSLSISWHNGHGRWVVGDPARAHALFEEPQPWQRGEGPVVVLATRGIGTSPVREPAGWSQRALRELRMRGIPAILRAHPGRHADTGGLLEQLRVVRAAVTWASTAGLKALLAGVPVYHGLASWLGREAARLFQVPLPAPYLADRWPMLEKLAWYMWSLEEIGRGDAFSHLLRRS